MDKLDKIIDIKLKEFFEQFANPNPFPHTPSDPTWNTGAYAPSIPIKDRRDIDDEEDEEDEKLQEIWPFSSTKDRVYDLPTDLINFLTGRVSPTIVDIKKLNKEEIKFLIVSAKHNADDYLERAKNSVQLVKDLQLYCIYRYKNGDTAWFSFVDEKIYDYNYELAGFNKLIQQDKTVRLSDKQGLNEDVPYKQWIDEIKAGKREYYS
jgi:hypothetical protein